MVRSYGFWLARRSFCYYLRHSTSFLSSLKGSNRSYGTGLLNHSRVLTNSNFGNVASERDWLRIGLLKANLGVPRLIHSTAHLSRDFYDVLGVSENATSSEIKKAYYSLAKKLHPDINKYDPEAQKNFQEVQKAYELGPECFKRGNGEDPGFDPEPIWQWPQFFDDFSPNLDLGGEDLKVTLELSFMEAIQGCTRTLTILTPSACDTCGGTGFTPGTGPKTCKWCRGFGLDFSQKGSFPPRSACPNCGGAGKIVPKFCKSCRGKRVVRGWKGIKLNVMAGVDNNETIKLPGAGGEDPQGIQPGDLYVIIKFTEDPVFWREGPDVHVDSFLSITQAIWGGTIQIPTLTGDVVLKVRPGTQPGSKVVLKGKGIKVTNSFTFGDQYVHYNIRIPKNLTQRQRQLIEEFAKEERGDYGEGVAEYAYA